MEGTRLDAGPAAGAPGGHAVEVRRVEAPDDLVTLAHWIDGVKLRLLVPVNLLRMQGAIPYGPQHPFVRALAEGEVALEEFYAAVQPRHLADYYGLGEDARRGADLPPWEMPWHLRRVRVPPPGEAGLGAEHGVSFYGPATPAKRALEMARLGSAAASVRERGYDPDTHGDIEGYAMRNGGDVVFFVRGGKHRAAVLAHLGWQHIPVAFRPSLPRLVDAAQAESWPLVRAGMIDVTLAIDILSRYTQTSQDGHAHATGSPPGVLG